MLKKFTLVFFIFLFIGCTSRKQALQNEHDLISTNIRALSTEVKSIVNLQYALENYIKVYNEYKEKKQIYKEIRKVNESKGYTVTKLIPDMNPIKELEEFNKQFNIISEKIRELENKLKEISKEIADLEAR